LQASKKMLMENDFLQSLRSFDKDHIPVPVVQKIKPYIANPEFEPNKILTVRMHLCCAPLYCVPLSFLCCILASFAAFLM
jgi:dynein heavy chain